MADGAACGWAPADDALYRQYHDTEWGVPVFDGRALWEKLQLDGMQAGLAWITILRKRDGIREVFEGFDPERLANWSEAEIEHACQDARIIRSRAKTRAVIGNARAFLEMEASGPGFARYCWDWVVGAPILSELEHWTDMPTKTGWSAAMSKDLKARGFAFVGPTIVYAWAQAVGLVNDHELGCPRRAACATLFEQHKERLQ